MEASTQFIKRAGYQLHPVDLFSDIIEKKGGSCRHKKIEFVLFFSKLCLGISNKDEQMVIFFLLMAIFFVAFKRKVHVLYFFWLGLLGT